MTMGDRIAVMHDGLIQQCGSPQELYDHPVNRFVAGFIGTPAMGFLNCSVSRRDGAATLVREGVNLQLPPEVASRLTLPDGAPAVAGVRPEDLRLVPVGSWPDEDSLVRGAVEVVEPLGPEQHLIVDIGGDVITARVGRDVHARPGEKVGLAVSPNRLRLFSADSGQALL